MTQSDIFDILNNNKGKKFTTQQLADKLGVLTGSITSSSKNLIKYKMIKTELIKKHRLGVHGRIY